MQKKEKKIYKNENKLKWIAIGKREQTEENV